MEDEDRASGKIRAADMHKYIMAGGGYRAIAFFFLLWACEHGARVCPQAVGVMKWRFSTDLD